MNKIFLIGNLTRDPETRSTSSGVSVCSFTLAVNRRFTGQSGERQTDFFRISAWRQLGENCQKYLAKGRKAAVMGELTARTYQDKNGETQVSLEVTADEVEFLSPRQQEGEGPAQGASYSSPAAHRSGSPLPDLAGFENISEDELPF